MELKITAEEAKIQQKAFEEIINHLKVDPEQVNWKYDWGQQVRGFSIHEVLSGEAQKDSERRRQQTLQERLDETEKAITCCLYGSHKRKYKSVVLEQVPKIVLDTYVKYFEEEIAEEKRIDSLTEEERAAEAEECLKQLRGTPGFMEVRISKE